MGGVTSMTGMAGIIDIDSMSGVPGVTGMTGVASVAGVAGMAGMDEVVGLALRNGKNIISNIYFGNDFIAIAEDNIENKNNEIISSLFRKRGNLKYLTVCIITMR